MSEQEKIDLENIKTLPEYQEFILAKLSEPSANFSDYVSRLIELDRLGCNISMLDTASQGMSAESGEFEEIVKKMKYQGKPWDEETRTHLIKELGDTLFYAMLGAHALGVSPADVIQTNIDKLSKRYKDGFSVKESEVREKGDI